MVSFGLRQLSGLHLLDGNPQNLMRLADMATRQRPSSITILARRRTGVAVAASVLLLAGVGLAEAKSSSGRTTAEERAKAVTQNWPSDKASIYQHMVAQAHAPTDSPKPFGVPSTGVPAPGVPFTSVPDPRVSGISPMRQGPFNNADFQIRNTYQAAVAGRWYVVYAGSLGTERQRAGWSAVRVISANALANTDLKDVGTLTTSSNIGALTAVGASGNVLALVGSNGAKTSFDLIQLTFG